MSCGFTHHHAEGNESLSHTHTHTPHHTRQLEVAVPATLKELACDLSVRDFELHCLDRSKSKPGTVATCCIPGGGQAG